MRKKTAPSKPQHPAKPLKKAVKKEAKVAPPEVKVKPKARKITRPKAEVAPRLLGLHNLVAPAGAHKHKKLLGRGPGSGHGKTSTRGSKGQTSRAGRHFYLGFEGGQMPLIRKIAKRGFTSNFRRVYQIVNLDSLSKIKEPLITLELLEQKGLIKDKAGLVKVLGGGEIKNPVTVQAHAFSKSASEKIKGAGGKPEIINA